MPAAITDGSLNLGHVFLISALAKAAPRQIAAAFRQPVKSALQGVPQREERPMTLMAIETVTALICSGSIFGNPGTNDDWSEWVKPLLTGALNAAPLDFGDVWAAALRYCVHCLSKTSKAGFNQLLDLLGDSMEVDGTPALPHNLESEMRAFLKKLVQYMQVGAQVIAAVEGHSNQDTDKAPEAPPQNGRNLLENVEIARLGTGLQVINQSLRGGEGVCVRAMRGTLLQMLPSLLKVQEMAAPELQPLALEAKSAAAVLKFLPVATQQIPEVLAAVEETSQHEQWPVRAAALVYAQYFWFRHMFQMTSAQSRAVQQMVVRLMRDKKLEVQELAADTLSGMLKGLSEADFHAIRSDLLAQMAQAFPKGMQRKAAAKDAVTVTERHAVVLGLKAFVLCTPYDVPQWLPEVLMALVRAATQPAPIKTTIRKTLGEFKRTHEQAGLSEVKRLLTEDQWEAVQGIASPASYYA